MSPQTVPHTTRSLRLENPYPNACVTSWETVYTKFLWVFVRPGRGVNPQPTTSEADTLTLSHLDGVVNPVYTRSLLRFYSIRWLYHRKVFIQFCLQIDPESYEWSWPEVKSTAANDNRRVKQTTLRYSKRVAIFGDKHYPNRNVRNALRVCWFDITISWKLCM